MLQSCTLRETEGLKKGTKMENEALKKKVDELESENDSYREFSLRIVRESEALKKILEYERLTVLALQQNIISLQQHIERIIPANMTQFNSGNFTDNFGFDDHIMIKIQKNLEELKIKKNSDPLPEN